MAEVQFVFGGILLFGSEQVAEAGRSAIGDLLAVQLIAQGESGDFSERWHRALLAHHQQVIASQSRLIGVMRDDIRLPDDPA